ncbi:MAG: hypothetical protein EOO88_24880 [Pedobacter sp.]|nr:MAG: hypothetical protein EOO88_24880 [Pedobacter sp.]
MTLSKKNVEPVLLDLNRNIELYADRGVDMIFSASDRSNINFPPNGGLTESESKQLDLIGANEDLKSAIRKIIANASAGVVFQLLTVVDGVATPDNAGPDWTGLKLIDEDFSEVSGDYGDMLHDSFFESYWPWLEQRPPNTWKLDNL